MRVDFDIDLSADSRADAMMTAEDITERVFKESFGRAEELVTEAMEVRELKPEIKS